MTTIPSPEVTLTDLVEWDKCKRELALLKNREMLLRKRIYNFYFPKADEGTNKMELSEGYLLKATRVVDRKVDLGTLQALAAEGGQLQAIGVNASVLIDWDPKLKIREYRTLTEEQRSIFDQALIIKDGSPQMEIVLPASRKSK